MSAGRGISPPLTAKQKALFERWVKHDDTAALNEFLDSLTDEQRSQLSAMIDRLESPSGDSG